MVLMVSGLLLSVPHAGAAVSGSGDTVTASDTKALRNDSVHSPPPGKAPPSRPGKPRLSHRGHGDRPPVPTQVYRPGIGSCMTGGATRLITDPTIEVPELVPACTAAPAAPGAPAGRPAPPPPTPLEAAYEAWYWETKLPSPTLSTSPSNGAVAGLDLYLSIGGQQSVTYDVPALGYMVHLEVSSVYDVDWGDPQPDGSRLGSAVTKGHRSQGGPYPNGDLRHQYIHRGSATVEVTQRWTARWSAGGQSGAIADRLATSGTTTFPVQEIQALLKP